MKIFPFKIPKTGDDAIMVQQDVQERFYDRLHQHEEIQISCILKGRGKLLVGDSICDYDKGSILMLGSYLPHVFKSEPRTDEISHMVSIFFTKDNFGSDLFQINELNPLKHLFYMAESGFRNNKPSRSGTMLFRKILESRGPDRFIHFFNLLLFLNQEEKSTLSGANFRAQLSDNEGERMGKVFDYLVSHFQEPISLTDVSDIASLTPTAFCRFFKTRTRKTFSQFLLELRMDHACKLLEAKGKRLMISEIAFQSGFNSVSNFNRFFKKSKGMSPLDYRASKITA